jgi:predicted PurR-regulated permease PerM
MADGTIERADPGVPSRMPPPQSGAPASSSRIAPADAPAVPRPPSWRDRFRGGFQADWDFVRRLLIAVAILGLAYFLWRITDVLLLVFVAILIAVLLSGFADLIARRTPIPKGWSLTVAVLVVAALLGGFLYLFGAQIGGQLGQVARQLPEAIDAVGARFDVPDAAEKLEEAIQSNAGGAALSRVAGLGFTVLGVLADLVLVIVAGVYLAADPDLYRRGAAKLLPPSQHERIFDAMTVTGNALRLWFGGQLVSMVLVGTVSGLAFWWIGLPSPLALGIIAGITNFIPFLGPILGSIPAVIFAFTIGTDAVLWTIGAVVVIQQIEGNVILPMVQRRAVSMPPALALFAIVIFGLLFGLLGVFLAAPLAVALLVLVKKLWVRETLGEHTVVPGEERAKAGGK